MARYIDADNLIEHLEDMIAECYTPDVDTQPIAYGSLLGLKYALSLVEALPTADITEVKHGVWIKAPCSEKDGNAHCSECNHWDWSDCSHCSNCGVKMDGGGK